MLSSLMKHCLASIVLAVHWHKPGQHHPARGVKDLKIKIMVSGGVGWWGKSELCICEKNINARYYTEILGEYLVPFLPNLNRYRLQHDNASPHTATFTRNWLTDHAVKLLEDYPPWSPELNPMEHVWSWMHAFVNAQTPTDRRSFERSILLGWQKLPDSVIRKYITNLRSVCKRIIAAAGDHI